MQPERVHHVEHIHCLLRFQLLQQPRKGDEGARTAYTRTAGTAPMQLSREGPPMPSLSPGSRPGGRPL